MSMGAKAVVDRVWDAIESDDFDSLEQLAQPDVEFRGVGAQIKSAAELRRFIEAYKGAFPDLRHEVVEYVESGDTVALELKVRGTHSGTLRGPQGEIPPTGRQVVWESVDYVKVRDDRVASWHVYNDQMAFMVQLGLVPDPAAQPA
jgi:predicted ester cyclase